jgi:small GTP-binding protein
MVSGRWDNTSNDPNQSWESPVESSDSSYPLPEEHLSDSDVDELDAVIAEFEQMQAELHYQDAQQALHQLMKRLKLTPRERSNLEQEVNRLENLVYKLDHQVIQIAVFGMVGRGKSSLLNALLGRPVFETGPIHGVTRTIQSAHWLSNTGDGAIAQSDLESTFPRIRIDSPQSGRSPIEVFDTPGLDEIHGQEREALARQIAQQVDLILFVVAGDLTRLEHEALQQLRQASKPMVLVINKIDQYPQSDRAAIYQKICDERVKDLLSPDEVVMASAAPLVSRAVRQADGSVSVETVRGEPEITDLKLKILDVLHREGKDLIALNTLLYADEIHDQVIQRKFQIRNAAAEDLIWSMTFTKAVAIALNPLTVVDVFSGAAIDVCLILGLSKLYGIPMNQRGAVDLLKTIALGLGGISLSELVLTLGLSSLKGVLGISAPFTAGASLVPYIPVAMAQAAIAGVSSYTIGQVSRTYFANGASWGTTDPKTLVQQILSNLDEASILHRLRQELAAKLERGDRPLQP